MAWDKTVPTSATYIVNIPTVFQNNYLQIENILGVQHYTFTSSLSGRHKSGLIGGLYANSTANIAALTGVTSGALAYDTDLAVLKRYDGAASAWNQINLEQCPIISVSRTTTNQTVPSAETGTYLGVIFNAEEVDVMSAHNTTNGRFTAPTNGYYYITSQIGFTGTESGINARLVILHYNSSGTVQATIGHYIYTQDTSTYTIPIIAILNMAATDYIAIAIWHDNSSSQIVNAGSDISWLKIYKLS